MIGNTPTEIPGSLGNPRKKGHRISNKFLVILDEALVKQLSIDENNTWFEEIPVQDGILLKICRNDL